MFIWVYFSIRKGQRTLDWETAPSRALLLLLTGDLIVEQGAGLLVPLPAYHFRADHSADADRVFWPVIHLRGSNGTAHSRLPGLGESDMNSLEQAEGKLH